MITARHLAGVTLLFLTTAANATSYPAMAPLSQYRIADRAAEIAMARSAAPASISAKATVLVLGAHGYETAAKGSNGFTCLVERGWMSPFDHAEFWNPKNRGPICYNAAAVATVLPYTLARTKLVLAGVTTKEKLLTLTKAAVARHELVAPAPGAMSYMLSRQQYLTDNAQHAWHPHLMFHVPMTDAASWAANQDGSPVIFDSAHSQGPEPQTIFMIPAPSWSDGTPDAPHHH